MTVTPQIASFTSSTRPITFRVRGTAALLPARQMTNGIAAPTTTFPETCGAALGETQPAML
jgi:hypothetical protein